MNMPDKFLSWFKLQWGTENISSKIFANLKLSFNIFQTE